MLFLRTVLKAKFVLNSHFVKEPPDSTQSVAHRVWNWHGVVWGTIQKTGLSTKTNKCFCACEESLCPHDGSGLAEKQNQAVSSTVPTCSKQDYSTLMSNRRSNPVWFGMIHCTLFGLICKILVTLTKLPWKDRKLFVFWLLVSAFTFFSNKTAILEIILRVHHTKEWPFQFLWEMLWGNSSGRIKSHGGFCPTKRCRGSAREKLKLPRNLSLLQSIQPV